MGAIPDTINANQATRRGGTHVANLIVQLAGASRPVALLPKNLGHELDLRWRRRLVLAQPLDVVAGELVLRADARGVHP
eukprot:scaffold549_cov72-Phaeocystis_antarctica.AAC.6